MKEDLKKEVGNKMRKIRKTLGYTQEKMVSHFEIGRANYSRIEKGEVWPGTPIYYTMRTKFNVSLDWLITNCGKMFHRDREKGEYEKLDFGTDTEEIKEVLSYMKKLPMVKHAMLSHFHEYIVKHEDAIKRLLKESEMSDNPGLESIQNDK